MFAFGVSLSRWTGREPSARNGRVVCRVRPGLRQPRGELLDDRVRLLVLGRRRHQLALHQTGLCLIVPWLHTWSQTLSQQLVLTVMQTAARRC